MKTHIIENGRVVNTILASQEEAQAAFQDAICIDGAVGGIGWVWDGETLTAPQVEPPPPTLEDFDRALTSLLDNTARARRWEDRISLMARAGFPGPWQQEAIAFGQWADSCNALAYQLLAEVEAGTKPLPTLDEFIALIPPMVWP